MPTEAQILAEADKQVEDLDRKKPLLKSLLYGDSGVGKTKLNMEIAQLITPPDKKILFYDSYEGWTTLENHPELKRRTLRVQWDNRAQASNVLLAVSKGFGKFENVGTIVWDEVSTMCDRDLDMVTQVNAAEDSKKGEDAAAWPDMNQMQTRMRRLFDQAYKIPDVNHLFVSHLRKDKDDKQVTVTQPDFLPKLGKRIREPLHLVGYMTAEQKAGPSGESIYKRSLQVHPTRLVIAKTRIAGLKVDETPDVLVRRVGEWMRVNDTTHTVEEGIEVE